MTIDFSIRASRNRRGHSVMQDQPGAQNRPARIACLLALAHRFECLLESGTVKDYAELARLGHVSRARITQIMRLLELAPAIQEDLLGTNSAQGENAIVTERQLRRILRQVRWDDQVALFAEIRNIGR